MSPPSAVLILHLLYASSASFGRAPPLPRLTRGSSPGGRHHPRGVAPGMERAASRLARSTLITSVGGVAFRPASRRNFGRAFGAMESGSRKRPLADTNIMSSTTARGEGPPPSSAAATRRRPLVVVIAGPTAVGKSDAAAELCAPDLASSVLGVGHGGGRAEIVSADSVQVYRGLDVGSNKPGAEERSRTVHHLIDVVDPPGDGTAASYSAAEWTRDASDVIGRLAPADGGEDDGGGQRVLPVVVGGTMMYLQWLVHGRPDAVRPSDAAAERAASRIASFRRGDGGADEDEDGAWMDASAYVSSLGPVFEGRVGRLPGRDWYRLRRLLEVAYTMAERRAEDAAAGGEGDGREEKSEDEVLRELTEDEVYTGLRTGSLADLGYDVRCFFLCPTERMEHFHVVDGRCESMLLRGLLAETSSLAAGGRLPDDSQAGRAIGYRQSLAYLSRDAARPGDAAALSAFVDDFAAATRRYAKKQMQWFRRDGSFAFVPVDMGAEKGGRAGEAARTIAGLCRLGRAEFDESLASDDGPSARTKRENEGQGRGMKYFISRRGVLVEGREEFDALLREADECTRLVQGLDGDFSPMR